MFCIKNWGCLCLFTDEEEESSSAEEVEEDGPSDLKRSQDKPSTDKCSNEKESEAGAEISALVNYVQPVHFFSFEISKSKCLSIDNWYLMLCVYNMTFSYNNKCTKVQNLDGQPAFQCEMQNTVKYSRFQNVVW